MRRISVTKLAKLLRVTPETLHVWRRNGLLPSLGRMGGGSNPAHQYDIEAVDAFLAMEVTGSALPPTVQQLQDRSLRLLTVEEAAEALGRSEHVVGRRINDGRLGAIRLAKYEWRITDQSLKEHVAACGVQDCYTIAEAARVLAVSNKTLSRLGPKTFHKADNLRILYLTSASLLELLAKSLPQGERAEAWLEDVLDDERPFWTALQVCTEFGITAETLNSLCKDRKFRFIRHGNRVSFLAGSIDAYRERQPTVNDETIARVFGVSSDLPKRWRRRGNMICPLHSHETQKFWRGCIVAMVGAQLNFKTSAAKFYDARLREEQKLVSMDRIAAHQKVSVAVVRSRAESGEYRGIKTPGGSWMLLPCQKGWQIRK